MKRDPKENKQKTVAHGKKMGGTHSLYLVIPALC